MFFKIEISGIEHSSVPPPLWLGASNSFNSFNLFKSFSILFLSVLNLLSEASLLKNVFKFFCSILFSSSLNILECNSLKSVVFLYES